MGLLGLYSLVGFFLFWFYGYFGILGSFGFFSYAGGDLPFFFLLDDVSAACFFMLFCCGSLAVVYCFHYFMGSPEARSLLPLVVWFLAVMAFLIFSASLVFTLVMWEYLGLVSFLLILFYSNPASLRASLITLFASRFGDVSLFMLIAWVSSLWGVSSVLFTLLIILVIATKSACYPFISWLLEAMRAPTPVSSLVHSSTLVAAGVWFLLRYSSFCSSQSHTTLFFFSLITIVITGVCASFFNDLKKIVALSTCNNVSWCIVFFICGDAGLALLQLLSHGICKCYLFMAVGDLMSLSGSSQSSVGVYLSRYSGGFNVFLQSLLVLSLCGVPFLGVFYSKHGLFSYFFYSCHAGYSLLLVLCFFISYVYSIRFVLLLLKSSGGLSLGYSSSFVLTSFTCLLGTVVNFFGCVLFEEFVDLSLGGSVILLLVPALGCFVGASIFIFGSTLSSGVWESFLWGSDCVVTSVYLGFQGVSSIFPLGLYRWEVYLFSFFDSRSLVFCDSRGALFSFNFMICGLMLILLFGFFVGL